MRLEQEHGADTEAHEHGDRLEEGCRRASHAPKTVRMHLSIIDA
jgi:hypothetical protein